MSSVVSPIVIHPPAYSLATDRRLTYFAFRFTATVAKSIHCSGFIGSLTALPIARGGQSHPHTVLIKPRQKVIVRSSITHALVSCKFPPAGIIFPLARFTDAQKNKLDTTLLCLYPLHLPKSICHIPAVLVGHARGRFSILNAGRLCSLRTHRPPGAASIFNSRIN